MGEKVHNRVGSAVHSRTTRKNGSRDWTSVSCFILHLTGCLSPCDQPAQLLKNPFAIKQYI